MTDLDDNKPTFAKDIITTGVRVDAALQTEVVKLEAEDKDPTALPIRFVQDGVVSLNGCAFCRSIWTLQLFETPCHCGYLENYRKMYPEFPQSSWLI